MKRVGHLYPAICAMDNLRLAFFKASRGKQGRPDVMVFRENLQDNLLLLREQLLSNEPDVGHYRFFHVRDPKQREICAASFPERVLHHAMMNICESVLDRYSIFDSYACRTGKGMRRAVWRCQEFSRKKKWFLKLDIAKYFDSICHDVVLAELGKSFKDKQLLDLFGQLLNTYHTGQNRGLPIGNLVSQHLANFYLGCFDHWLKEDREITCYLRYMDDFILFGDSRQFLKQELACLKDFLADKLALRLHKSRQLNRCSLGMPFLGFRVFPGKIMLGTKSKQRFKAKFIGYEKLYMDGCWTEQELARHMAPLIDYTKVADSFAFRQNVIERYGVCT